MLTAILYHVCIFEFFPEIVYVATVNSNHAELSIKMMNVGKHILCEKPMAMNLKQARKVFQAAKDNNVFFTEVKMFAEEKKNLLLTVKYVYLGKSPNHYLTQKTHIKTEQQQTVHFQLIFNPLIAPPSQLHVPSNAHNSCCVICFLLQ